MIETEACFKAAQIAIQQGCPLQAASFLKNVVLINLTLTEQEKVKLLLSHMREVIVLYACLEILC